LDDFDKAARLSFRNYPSTSLVMIAALGSGLGWMAHKWLGRKRARPDDGNEVEDKPPDALPPAEP
jgi:hypothetical protein